MSREKDKEMINIKCNRCRADIKIKYGTYRKSHDHLHYCRSCRGKIEHERIKSLSEDERKVYLDKKNQAISSGWKKQSSDKKEQISQMRKEEWNDEKRRKKHIEMLLKRWENMNENQRIQHLEKMAIGKEGYWANPKNKEFHSNRAREKWYNQPQNEQDRILGLLSVGREKFLDNLTLNDKIKISKKRSESLKKHWANLTPQQFEERISIFKERLKENFDNLDIVPNKNESSFIDKIDEFNISHEFVWYNKIKHPDFNKLFPFNPVRPGLFINPYHAWDFIIYTNEGNILVDIDGSIHNPECTKNKVTDTQGNKFILGDYIQFKDSQRPYQTDGLDAYIIQCYNDNLTDDTPVVNINTGEKMSFKSFMAILIWMNMNDKEKEDLLQLI